MGSGAGGVFGGLGLGSGLTGAGFSSGGGVGTASRASRCLGAGAGAATSSTAYDGGPALTGFTWVNAKRRGRRVHQHGPDQSYRGARRAATVGADDHCVSSSAATRPTFWMPAPRMIARTRTTCP